MGGLREVNLEENKPTVDAAIRRLTYELSAPTNKPANMEISACCVAKHKMMATSGGMTDKIP